MLATASAQVCVPLGHSSLYFYYVTVILICRKGYIDVRLTRLMDKYYLNKTARIMGYDGGFLINCIYIQTFRNYGIL